jgi:putative transposase
VALRVRDLMRKISMEHELQIISGKVASDHVHVFVSYRATQKISQIVQWLKGTSSKVIVARISAFKETVLGKAPVG